MALEDYNIVQFISGQVKRNKFEIGFLAIGIFCLLYGLYLSPSSSTHLYFFKNGKLTDSNEQFIFFNFYVFFLFTGEFSYKIRKSIFMYKRGIGTSTLTAKEVISLCSLCATGVAGATSLFYYHVCDISLPGEILDTMVEKKTLKESSDILRHPIQYKAYVDSHQAELDKIEYLREINLKKLIREQSQIDSYNISTWRGYFWPLPEPKLDIVPDIEKPIFKPNTGFLEPRLKPNSEQKMPIVIEPEVYISNKPRGSVFDRLEPIDGKLKTIKK